ncbi:hypothetical protein ACP4OV_009613 [Aristida adscensionis]
MPRAELQKQATPNFISRAGINWRGRNNLSMIRGQGRNAFQACAPSVLSNYINTQAPLHLVNTRADSLLLGPKMGHSFSAFNKFGLPGISSVTTKQVFEQHFKDKPTAKFEDFHIAYVEFCKYFNTVMPGRDFYTPPLETIRDFYETGWKDLKDEEKKQAFFEFMRDNVRDAEGGESFFIMAGLAAPAAAVIGKRASKNIPYVKNLKLEYVPNVVFVPLFTLGAIIAATAAQMSRKSATEAGKEKKEEEKNAAEQKKKNGEATKAS